MKKAIVLALTATTALAVSAFSTYAADFKIGLSNGWVGSEWRTQMIEEAQAAAAAWKDKGVNVEVVVQSANVDVPGQIAQVRNFMSQGVNAIIINPNSPTAFDPIFKQAKDAGIMVIATDAEVSSASTRRRGALPAPNGWPRRLVARAMSSPSTALPVIQPMRCALPATRKCSVSIPTSRSSTK